MVSLKILPFLLSLGLPLIPQIIVAQTIEEFEQKPISAEEVNSGGVSPNSWRRCSHSGKSKVKSQLPNYHKLQV
ncbi:hypothetical protein [uncultured Nostoc sp.]|uniref:hypothetical protein n=1 Tax=uncultured Nostoc sp. TaxID=340711 RepID=UPI0035CB4FA5